MRRYGPGTWDGWSNRGVGRTSKCELSRFRDEQTLSSVGDRGSRGGAGLLGIALQPAAKGYVVDDIEAAKVVAHVHRSAEMSCARVQSAVCIDVPDASVRSGGVAAASDRDHAGVVADLAV